jgi:hypothetical protein
MERYRNPLTGNKERSCSYGSDYTTQVVGISNDGNSEGKNGNINLQRKR